MKIVQSFWSKPNFKSADFNASDRNTGGWLDKKTNYMSWALSCLQFKKYYDEVELVTDKAGYRLLIDKMELPYTSVKVVLDDLNSYHPDLWALGKIFAYSIQDRPFIHVDGDVYIWERLDETLENAPLLAQNVEKFNHYDESYKSIAGHFDFIPEDLKLFRQHNKKAIAINAGVIGGNNIDFFKNYTKGAFEFVDRNIERLSPIDVGMFNTVFEQYFFYAMAHNRGERIEYLIKKEVNHAFDGLADFTGVPQRVKFIHAIGYYKKLRYVGEQLQNRLQYDFPEWYYKIINLINTYQV